MITTIGFREVGKSTHLWSSGAYGGAVRALSLVYVPVNTIFSIRGRLINPRTSGGGLVLVQGRVKGGLPH